MDSNNLAQSNTGFSFQTRQAITGNGDIVAKMVDAQKNWGATQGATQPPRPAPCRTCGTCPTCGRRPPSVTPYVAPLPYTPNVPLYPPYTINYC